jgi:hypothetical protein
VTSNSIPRRLPPTLRELQRVAKSAETKAPTLAEVLPGGSLRQFLSDQVGSGRLLRHIAAWSAEHRQAVLQALTTLRKVVTVP